jgi:guanylate kinase
VRGKRGLIFVVSGPSGSGKTTLLKQLLKGLKDLKHKLVKSISFTTRPKRPRERDRKDYFFLTNNEFNKKLRAKKILERTRYLGYDYGTPKDFVEGQLKKGRHILLCLDLKGAFKIKKLYPRNSVTIFVLPPSLAALEERIIRRGSKTQKEEVRQRLRLAREELIASSRYDYCLMNKNLNQAVRELKDIISREIDG